MFSIQGSKLKLIKVALKKETTCKIKLKTKNLMKYLVKSFHLEGFLFQL